MSLKSEIKNLFGYVGNDSAVEITILEDYKYKFGETLVFENIDSLLPHFKKGEFEICGGDDKVFYIKNKKDRFAFQLKKFEFFKDYIDLIV